MWEGRRLGSQPEQLGEIKNNSIPGDWGNYSGREGGRERRRDVRSERFKAMWSLAGGSVDYARLNRQGGFKGTVLQWLAKANKLQLYFQCRRNKHTFTYTHQHTHRHAVNTRPYASVESDQNAPPVTEWPLSDLSVEDGIWSCNEGIYL